MPTHSPLEGAVFDSEAIDALALAFEGICKDMRLPESASVAREVVAARVIDLAREGVLDPNALRERVLQEARALPVEL